MNTMWKAGLSIKSLGRLDEAPFELKLSENARAVYAKRYLRKSPEGRSTETAHELLMRVAGAMAAVEAAHEKKAGRDTPLERIRTTYFNLMAAHLFMPNSPTLMNAGREPGMLSACFVLPVKDSIDSIYEAVKDQALIQKAGGGTGFDFSQLRSRGDYIASSGGSTPGPLAFMDLFSHSSQVIQQGAFRRGANMAVMSVRHPDIADFIDAKGDPARLRNFNLSVGIDDAFMKDLRESPDAPLEVVDPLNGRRSRHAMTNRETWQLIARRAWQSGEPGLLFIDRVNAAQPTPHLGAITATNPCGEQPLLPYESCNLASINVSRLCRREGEAWIFDWEAFDLVARLGVRFLDNVVDANRFPIAALREANLRTRKIGLGIMGWADLLFRLGIAYASEEAVALGARLARRLKETSHAESAALAAERGSFGEWAGSRWQKDWGAKAMRNACVTSIAPTGTISLLADCSAGIEPLFSLVYTRQIMEGERLLEVNPLFADEARRRGILNEALIEEVARAGTLQHIESVPVDLKKLFQSAHDVDPEWHLRHQAAFQDSCDSAVSKTINLREEASVDDVMRAYSRAFELGCKGVTVYRNASRTQQPMALGVLNSSR